MLAPVSLFSALEDGQNSAVACMRGESDDEGYSRMLRGLFRSLLVGLLLVDALLGGRLLRIVVCSGRHDCCFRSLGLVEVCGSREDVEK
jgi:hypothetical protein